MQKKLDTCLKREVKNDKYIFENFQVSEDGDAIYVLGKSYEDTLKKKKTGAKYFFELTKVMTNSHKVITIDPKEHFIGYLKPIVRKNEILCLGFFSEFDDQYYTGLCHFKIDAELSQITKTLYNTFPRRFILDKYGEKNEYKALKNLTIRNVFFNSNNDIIINSEEEDVWTSASGVGIGVGTKTKITYKYGDIGCFKLNANGTLQWARNINKNQKQSDEDHYFISFSSMINNSANFIFINASESINKLKEDRIEFGKVNINKSNLNLIKINHDGNWDYQEILEATDNTIPLMVSKGIVIDNSIYFLGNRGKTKQLLKVTL